MSRYTQQTTWGRGEIDPKLQGRQDAEFYAAGAKELDNWLPDTVGGIETRYGFAAVGDLPSWIELDDGQAQLRPSRQTLLGYVFRDTQVIIHIGAYVTASGFEVLVVQARRVSITLLDTESPADISTVVTAGIQYVSPPTLTTERTLYEVGFAVAGPAAFITHPAFPPLRVFPTSLDTDDAVFNVEPVSWFQELFGLATPTPAGTLWTGSEEALFVGQLTAGDRVKFRNQFYTVSATGTTTDDDGNVFDTFTTEETYSGLEVADRVAVSKADPFGGNPALCGFYQSRLVLATTATKPTGVWLSRSNDPFTIVPSAVADDSPINAELFAEGADEFVWLTGGDRLYFGSGLGEYSLGTSDETLTPTQLRFFRIGNNGGAAVTPVNVESTVVFVNRARSQVLSVIFDFSRQGFSTSNLSELSSHLTQDVVDLAFRPPVRNDRTPRVFALTAKQELRAFALSAATGVVAWSPITYSPAITVRAIAATSEYLFAAIVRRSGRVQLAILRNE